MDWNNLIADKEMLIGNHFSQGRDGSQIRFVVLHHNAGNLSIEDCYRVWQTREASAHYQVQSDGKIGQLVNDWDTAWHAGDWGANIQSIGIEHADISSNPWRISDECLDAGAHLTAAICKKYNLGIPVWNENVFPHNRFSSTACPASLGDGGSQNQEYMQRAREWYAQMTGDVDAPMPIENDYANDIPQVTYRSCTAEDGLLAPVTDLQDFAGVEGHAMTYIAIDFCGHGWYQACTEKSGWLPVVRNFNPDDLENGCAGDGSPITAIRAYYETQNPNSTGWLKAQYRVAPIGGGYYEWQNDNDQSVIEDGFAGTMHSRIDRFQLHLVRS